MTELPEDDAEAVLRIIEEGGVFDELRQLLISKIRENVSSTSFQWTDMMSKGQS